MNAIVPDEPEPVEPTDEAGVMPDDPPQEGISQRAVPDLAHERVGVLRALMRRFSSGKGPTARHVVAFAASQIGAGERPANVNKYTRWYYGGNTAAPWCWIFVCYCFDQCGALDLIFGKHAYVPDFKKVFSAHGRFHKSRPKAGDLVVFDFNGSGSPEHMGIVEKVVSGSTLQTIEGNTHNHVRRRRRSRSYVYGYATPEYAPAR
jgi:CHAP domain